MNTAAAQRIVDAPWEPIMYGQSDLVTLLAWTEFDADLCIWEITGEAEAPGVSHHELKGYLTDIMSISEVPDRLADLPVQGQWLTENGWGVNPARTTYRWVSPYVSDRTRQVAFPLRVALQIELRYQFAESDDLDDGVIEAEFEVIDEN